MLEAEILKIYEEWNARAKPRSCAGRADCCRFRLTGEVPHVTKGEALLVWKGWKATGRKDVPEKSDGSCPFLSVEGRCQIYEFRPFACRTHFCVAEGGAVARREVRDFIQRLDDLDQKNGGDGARMLPSAVLSCSQKKAPKKRRRN